MGFSLVIAKGSRGVAGYGQGCQITLTGCLVRACAARMMCEELGACA